MLTSPLPWERGLEPVTPLAPPAQHSPEVEHTRAVLPPRRLWYYFSNFYNYFKMEHGCVFISMTHQPSEKMKFITLIERKRCSQAVGWGRLSRELVPYLD